MDESTPAAAPPPIPKTAQLAPKDHAEAVAIFRSEIVGALTRKDLDHGGIDARTPEPGPIECGVSHPHPPGS